MSAELDCQCDGSPEGECWKHTAPVAAAGVQQPVPLFVIFDGPPGPEPGRFVEVETAEGLSTRVGEWKQRPDGLWSLGPLYLAPVAVAGPDARDALLRDIRPYVAEAAKWNDPSGRLAKKRLDRIDAALGQQAGGPATTATTETEKPHE